MAALIVQMPSNSNKCLRKPSNGVIFNSIYRPVRTARLCIPWEAEVFLCPHFSSLAKCQIVPLFIVGFNQLNYGGLRVQVGHRIQCMAVLRY